MIDRYMREREREREIEKERQRKVLEEYLKRQLLCKAITAAGNCTITLDLDIKF